MTQLPLLSIAAQLSAAPSALPASGLSSHLDPLKLFLDADSVVKVVLIALVLASVWGWTIIISFAVRLASLKSACAAYEADFWKTRDLDAFQAERASSKRGGDLPLARIVTAALGEWRRSVNGKVDRDAARGRLAAVMGSVVEQEAETLGSRLNFLATVASSAPFVGLFGTVWGIMNSFFQIGQQQNSSLSVVAPGISEALFATAVGLFAAIPALIAYNAYSHAVTGFEGRLQRFADRFHVSLSRELDGM